MGLQYVLHIFTTWQHLDTYMCRYATNKEIFQYYFNLWCYIYIYILHTLANTRQQTTYWYWSVMYMTEAICVKGNMMSQPNRATFEALTCRIACIRWSHTRRDTINEDGECSEHNSKHCTYLSKTDRQTMRSYMHHTLILFKIESTVSHPWEKVAWLAWG